MIKSDSERYGWNASFVMTTESLRIRSAAVKEAQCGRHPFRRGDRAEVKEGA